VRPDVVGRDDARFRWARVAGVAEPDVDLPVGLPGEADDREHVALQGHVGSEPDSVDLRHRAVHGVGLDVGDDDLGTLGGETAGTRRTDAIARAGDDDDLALQLHEISLLCPSPPRRTRNTLGALAARRDMRDMKEWT
jgi:hypothetical protein